MSRYSQDSQGNMSLIAGSAMIDSALSDSSTNAVQNRVITGALNKTYKSDDTTDTSIDDADFIPFYDTSAQTMKKIAKSNFGGGGSGSGDMTKAVYDSDDSVEDAGGIKAFVDGEIEDVYEVMGQNGAKNLLVNNVESGTYNSLSVTKNSDGSLTFNGTASSVTNIDFMTSHSVPSTENKAHSLAEWGLDKNQKYIITIGQSSNVGAGIRLVYLDSSMNVLGDNYYTILSDSYNLEFTGTFANTEYLKILAYASTSAKSNVTIKPMVRDARDTDPTYQPYTMTNQEITPYVQSISNPNLLDNPWFTVNQRGQSSYVNLAARTYFFDRWRTYDGNGFTNHTISLTSDGMKIAVSGTPGASVYFQQLLDGDEFVVGETYTISMIIKSSSSVFIYFQLRTNGTTMINLEDAQKTIGTEWKLVKATGTITSNNKLDIRLYPNYSKAADVDIYVKAIKVERGRQSTLEMDSPPDYGTELLKCQMSTADSNDAYANRNATGAELVLTQTATTSTSADTTYTFTNSAITTDSEIEVYTDQWGVNPSNVVTTTGQCVVTIPKQSTASTLGVRIHIR